MIKITSLVLLSGLLSLFFVSPVWAEQSLVFSANSISEFEIGQYPFINGKTVDSNGNPLSDVEIQANFPSRIITTTTNSTGEFSIVSSIPAELGEYTITIYATIFEDGVIKNQNLYEITNSGKRIFNEFWYIEPIDQSISNFTNLEVQLDIDSSDTLNPFEYRSLSVFEVNFIIPSDNSSC